MAKEEINKDTLTDEELLDLKIREWKKVYSAVYKTVIADETIIFRPISRKEWKELMLQGIDDKEELLDKEEQLIKTTVLYPDANELEKIIEDYAGVSEIISDQIMFCSGFSNVTPTKL